MEGLLTKINNWLQGKKTYIIVGLVIVGVILTVIGIVIPPAIWIVLGALGLGAIRSAVEKISAVVKELLNKK